MITATYLRDKIVTTTTTTTYIYQGQVINKPTVSNRALSTISKIKSYINKEKPYLKGVSKLPLDEKRLFLNQNLTEGLEYVEIDISNAFPTIAHNIGLINDELFERISKLPKSERLMTLGAISSNKTVTTYDEQGNIIDEKKIKPFSDAFFNLILKKMEDINDKVKSLLDYFYPSYGYLMYMDAFLIEKGRFLDVDFLTKQINTSCVDFGVTYRFKGTYVLTEINDILQYAHQESITKEIVFIDEDDNIKPFFVKKYD